MHIPHFATHTQDSHHIRLQNRMQLNPNST